MSTSSPTSSEVEANIELVKDEIESCVQKSMSLQEIMTYIERHHEIPPDLTLTLMICDGIIDLGNLTPESKRFLYETPDGLRIMDDLAKNHPEVMHPHDHQQREAETTNNNNASAESEVPNNNPNPDNAEVMQRGPEEPELRANDGDGTLASAQNQGPPRRSPRDRVPTIRFLESFRR